MNSTYQVLSVRHRPRILDDMLGQDLAVKSVRGFLKSGRIPQTILISGPYGSGKTTLARMIARYLNCDSPLPVEGSVYGEPCGKCWSCQELSKPGEHSHPDVHEANAAEQRGIDAVRGWISQSKYKPTRSKFRVFIIDECHAITSEALNAFLKPLEEPSKSTVWILGTTEPSRLTHTMRSRTVPIKIMNVTVEDCSKILSTVLKKENIDLPGSTEYLVKISEVARGHPREALQILESVINIFKSMDTKDLDVDQVVAEVAAEVVGDTPEAAARQYLLGVYSGKFTKPLKIIQTVNNPQLFLDSVLRYHSHTMKFVCSKRELWDKYYMDYYNKLQSEGFHSRETIGSYTGTKPAVMLRPRAIAAVTETFFEGLANIKSYITDPYLILFRMTMKAVLEWQDIVSKEEEIDAVKKQSLGQNIVVASIENRNGHS